MCKKTSFSFNSLTLREGILYTTLDCPTKPPPQSLCWTPDPTQLLLSWRLQDRLCEVCWMVSSDDPQHDVWVIRLQHAAAAQELDYRQYAPRVVTKTQTHVTQVLIMIKYIMTVIVCTCCMHTTVQHSAHVQQKQSHKFLIAPFYTYVHNISTSSTASLILCYTHLARPHKPLFCPVSSSSSSPLLLSLLLTLHALCLLLHPHLSLLFSSPLTV